VPQNDSGIEVTTIERIQDIPRHGDTHLHHKPRVGTAHALEEEWQFGPDNVMTDTNDQPSLFNGKTAKGTPMCDNKGASRAEKGTPVHGKLDVSWRAFEQPPTKAVFQPFDLQAHRRLRRIHRFGRTGEASEVGGENERLDRF
jgi:hypothetical protein